jgi:hypothetical protein
MRPNEPDSTARGAGRALPLIVPEIDAPAEVDEGPTGDNEAFPPHAVARVAMRTNAKIVMPDRTTFMIPPERGLPPTRFGNGHTGRTLPEPSRFHPGNVRGLALEGVP